MITYNNIKISVFIAAAVLLQACGAGRSEEKKAAPAEETVVVRDAVQVHQGSLTSSLKLPGELVAHQQVDLYAKVSSFVKRLYVDVGSEVHAGQLLALMEAPEMNAQLSGAQSKLRSQEALYLASKATYNRLLETSKTPGTISPNDLDVAEAKQKSDLAQLEAARAAYREVSDTRNYLQVRAPFNGVITSRNVSAGAYVGPTGKGSDQPMFTVQEQKRLRLVVSVPEAYVGYLNAQGVVEFKVKAFPEKTFHAKVIRLAGALDSRLRSQRTEMDVTNADKTLLPGMVAEVSLPLAGGVTTFIVPTSAVLNSTEGVYVIRVENGKTVWVPVTTGRSDRDRMEVFGALRDHDTLMSHATEEIRNGAEAGKIKLASQ